MLLFVLLTIALRAAAQVPYTPPGNIYGPFDPRRSKPPNPGDVDYRTYTFNSRRYGETYFPNDPRYPNMYQGGFPQKPVYNPADGTFRYPVRCKFSLSFVKTKFVFRIRTCSQLSRCRVFSEAGGRIYRVNSDLITYNCNSGVIFM